MEKIKMFSAHKFFKMVMWAFLILLGLFIIVVIGRLFYRINLDKTEVEVAKIHATKLTLDDVIGKNLPPDPGIEADKAVQGIDANKNGIRDDVEIAIFKEYPNSAKTRAVLLQYALALQMEVTQSIVNKETVTAVAEDSGRAYMCIGEITSRNDMKKFIDIGNILHSFIEDRQLNTKERKKAQIDFYNGNLRSYSSPNNTCDLDLSKLPN